MNNDTAKTLSDEQVEIGTFQNYLKIEQKLTEANDFWAQKDAPKNRFPNLENKIHLAIRILN